MFVYSIYTEFTIVVRCICCKLISIYCFLIPQMTGIHQCIHHKPLCTCVFPQLLFFHIHFVSLQDVKICSLHSILREIKQGVESCVDWLFSRSHWVIVVRQKKPWALYGFGCPPAGSVWSRFVQSFIPYCSHCSKDTPQHLLSFTYQLSTPL